MNEKIDVLAVMALERDCSEVRDRRYAETLREARAAVAELIRQMDRLAVRLDSAGRPGHCDYIGKSDAALVIRAALARVGGAK